MIDIELQDEGSLRSPQALHKVRAPSGPRLHSGVSVVLHEWHLGLLVARFCFVIYVFAFSYLEEYKHTSSK